MFNRMPTTESTTRFTFTAACGLSIFAAGAAIFLRMRELTGPALLFLGFALVGCYVTLTAYKQYRSLRTARWQTELKRGDDELNQVLNHARMSVIIEHVTGPLQVEMAGPDPQNPGLEGQEVAQR